MTAVLYLTPAQLCARWLGRISDKTLANWRSDQKGPRYKRFGSRILYPLDGVEEWEREQEHQSTSEYSTRAKKAAGKTTKRTSAETSAARKQREATERIAAEMGEIGREIERLLARRDELAAQIERPRRRRAG